LIPEGIGNHPSGSGNDKAKIISYPQISNHDKKQPQITSNFNSTLTVERKSTSKDIDFSRVKIDEAYHVVKNIFYA
jgi:hypothetical protein